MFAGLLILKRRRGKKPMRGAAARSGSEASDRDVETDSQSRPEATNVEEAANSMRDDTPTSLDVGHRQGEYAEDPGREVLRSRVAGLSQIGP